MTTITIPRACLAITVAAVSACALAWGAARILSPPVRAADPVAAPGQSREARAFLATQASLAAPASAADQPALPPRGPGATPGPALTYTTMLPCRIVDTREIDQRLPAGSSYTIRSVLADYSVQGGVAEGCGIDGLTPQAIVVNVTAVLPSAAGFATVFPYPEARPLAASVNYASGAIVNNTVVTKVDTSTPGGRFRLYTYAGADYVIDLVGYYSPDAGRQSRVDCYDRTANRYAPSGQNVIYYMPASCDAGYTVTAVQCQSLGSTAEGYQGQATIEWSNTGVFSDEWRGELRVGCVGRDIVPTSAGGGSPFDMKEYCCRVIEEPIPPPAP